ncbi:MAG TPA: PRC-barrel domain-containing protein [Capsulimonadaceae bacterium]|nr:PRC-barrel domain-containing protein [Capsulimonadaceae bacterium]
MLRNMSDLVGYAIRATDGPIGHVKDFYFDDEVWVVRYLIADTGSWLSSRKVLISPISVGQSNWVDKMLSVSITREQVKNSPDIDTDKPVSRQHEMEYLGYYGYPYYWGGAGFWGAGVYPSMMLLGIGNAGAASKFLSAQAGQDRAAREAAKHQNGDPHLRSGKLVTKYHIEASDGGIGHVQGLLLDEDTWAIRYLIVDTSNWWLGHQVLIAPQWIKNVSWPEHTVLVNLTRQAVKDAPPYDPALTLDRDDEIGLHKHYERAGYWADEVKLQNPRYRAIKSAPPGAIQKNV